MEPHRSERLSEALREELSELIGYEMSDPRVASVDVTDVVLAPDMRHARVRISCPGDEKQRLDALRALEGARHFLRRELAARLRLFRIPELCFEPDLEAGARGRVEELLRRIRKGRPRPEASGGSAGGTSPDRSGPPQAGPGRTGPVK